MTSIPAFAHVISISTYYLGQGFPTFLWPCTPWALRQTSMCP